MSDHRGRIEIRDLSKSYGGFRAVDGVSFTVEPGTIVGFLGPNGAGKTTTLRILLGLARPDSGQALISGQPYERLPQPSNHVGAVIDASGFHAQRTGRRHLRIYCTVNGYPLARADEVLDAVGLGDAADRKAGEYSLGMRQRLSLGLALLGDPQILVLDEPANGLDPEGIVWMRRLLRDLADQGRTVLVSSHVLSEVQQTADRIVIVNKGRLIRQGTVAELAGAATSTVSVRTTDPEALAAALTAKPGVTVERIDPDALRVTGLPVADVGRAAYVAQLPVLELTEHRTDLEDIFFAVTAGAHQEASPSPR